MVKSQVTAVFTAVILFLFPYTAQARDIFLCMRDGESTAITNDDSGDYKYIELVDSKGTKVSPQISSDGSTYLPFRYICDIMGIADANKEEGDIPENSYRYKGADTDGGKASIEIKYNGVHVKHNIDESFEYSALDGSVRTVAIYNIRGTLYAPMAYLADLCGSIAQWDAINSRIMFVGNSDDFYDFLTGDATLRRDKQMRLEYEIFGNNLTDTPLYLKSDGMTVANLAAEMADENVKCVSRSGKMLYYVSGSRLYMTEEDSGKCQEVKFYDESGKAADVYTENVFALKNKLYGIKSDCAGSKTGYVFSADLDGKNFRIISSVTAYNLTLKNDSGDYYMFYCDASTRCTLHMIRQKTMDDYEIQITNFGHENMLSGIKQFAVGSNRVYYLDDYGAMHIIELNYPLEKVSIARLKYGNTIYSVGSDGGQLNNIVSMNYDYYNDTLYIMQKDSEAKIYYANAEVSGFVRVAAFNINVGTIALFADTAYANHISFKCANSAADCIINYNGGAISIE